MKNRDERRVLVTSITGRPRTQGSMSLFRAPDGREIAKYAQPTIAHRNVVIGALAAAWGGKPPIEGPVAVQLRFFYARPQDHYGTGRNDGILKDWAPYWPASKQDDVDKSARLVNDALVYAGVLCDDGQVCVLRAEKRYQDRGLSPCTIVEVHEL